MRRENTHNSPFTLRHTHSLSLSLCGIYLYLLFVVLNINPILSYLHRQRVGPDVVLSLNFLELDRSELLHKHLCQVRENLQSGVLWYLLLVLLLAVGHVRKDELGVAEDDEVRDLLDARLVEPPDEAEALCDRVVGVAEREADGQRGEPLALVDEDEPAASAAPTRAGPARAVEVEVAVAGRDLLTVGRFHSSAGLLLLLRRRRFQSRLSLPFPVHRSCLVSERVSERFCLSVCARRFFLRDAKEREQPAVFQDSKVPTLPTEVKFVCG